MSKHQKVYQSEEEKMYRFEAFQASMERIAARNQQSKELGSDAVFGLNKFSDMTTEEFREKVLMKPFTSDKSTEREVVQPRSAAPPNSFDWRSKGAVTAVKDQGQCGSCWAFSAVETIESSWMLAKGINATNMTLLSPQQVVDCDYLAFGCGGGEPVLAYEYILGAGGLESEEAYPYVGEGSTCQFQQSEIFAKISSWKWATTDFSETLMVQNLYSWGPLSICVDANVWQDYQNGVLTAAQCAWINQLDHCVQAVGYNLQASTPYWIVRNSWGTDWGIDGYIYLQYGHSTCGLNDSPTVPVI
eukprot:TRINITY_DN149_c0_g2_i1.p1 TRINITY_DN149_c0_g2~~TRINITY_DN149_c0_g2_i1.p1  ORF type:complete len:351 (-),score=86.91 TRINITY_DN149_c0_g2_i1:95-1000(-)